MPTINPVPYFDYLPTPDLPAATPAKPGRIFDYSAAKKAGATDQQIADELGFDYGGAIKAGATPQQISDELFKNSYFSTSSKIGPQSASERLLAGTQAVSKAAAPIVLPAAGMLAAPLLAPLAGAGAVGTGLIAGGLEAAGSMAGEKANQMFGITPPSTKNLILAGAIPPAARIGTAGVKLAFSGGRSIAESLNEMGYQAAKGGAEALRPPISPNDLFALATQPTQTTINMVGAGREAAQQYAKLNSGALNTVRPTAVLNLLDDVVANAGVLKSPQGAQADLENFGNKLHELDRSGINVGGLKQVFKAMNNDLKSTPEGLAVWNARIASKRSNMVDSMLTDIEQANKLNRGQGGATQFNANQVITKLEKDPWYEQSFSSEERTQLKNVLTDLNNIPALKPGAGQQSGSADFWKSVGMPAAVGEALATATGVASGPTGLIAGGLAGNTFRNLRTIWNAPKGMGFKLLSIMSGGKVTNPQTINATARFLDAMAQQEIPGRMPSVVPSFDINKAAPQNLITGGQGSANPQQ